MYDAQSRLNMNAEEIYFILVYLCDTITSPE